MPIAKFILDLLSLVLHNMNFEFNGEHFLRNKQGALPLAHPWRLIMQIYMNRFETKALSGYHLKPLTWKRFIDDIFMVWTHGQH